MKQTVPNQKRIREALAQRIKCDHPGCGGTGEILPGGPGDAPVTKCPKCEGKGTVARQVPGARLLPRGERIEVK